MTHATTKSNVLRGDWTEVTQEKRKGRFLFLFPTEWWETVSTKMSGSELHCNVDEGKTINAVYVNGKKYTL